MAFTVPNQASASNAVQAQLDSIDFTVASEGMVDNGIIRGYAVSQRGAGANMSVDLSQGLGYFNQYYMASNVLDVSQNLTITAAHASLPRLDVISVGTTGGGIVTAGTPAAVPRCPTYTTSMGVVVAVVYVGAAVTSIVNANITDKRIIIPDLYDSTTEFLTYEPTSKIIGEYGDYLLVSTGTPAWTITNDSSAGHPGQLTLTYPNTGSASVQVTTAVQGRGGTPELRRSTFVMCRTSQNCNLNVAWRSSTSTFSNQIYAYMASGNSQWVLQTVLGGATTSTFTGALAAANAWQQIEFIRDAAGYIVFMVNGIVQARHNTNLPTTTVLTLHMDFYIGTNDNTNQAVLLDFIGVKWGNNPRSRF